MCRWEEGVPSAGSLMAMGRRRPSLKSVRPPSTVTEAAAEAKLFFEGVGEGEEEHHFLDSCFLCRRPLVGGCDIFMYMGDKPFCSEDCREEQMQVDELKERRRRRRTLRAVEGLRLPQDSRAMATAGTVTAG